MGYTGSIQDDGRIILPEEWREKHGLNAGAQVRFVETTAGLLVVPAETVLMNALDDLGQHLREKGITLEELIESGREERAALLRENLPPEADGT